MAMNFRTETAKSNRVQHVDEAENLEDNTAFGDVISIGGEDVEKKVDFAPDASSEVVNFALDDQVF